MYQLRIYTIKNKKYAEEYMQKHWKKHLISLPKFNIHVHNVFIENNKEENTRIFALVSSNDNLHELNQKYMHSKEFLDDMKGFNMDAILNVQDIDLGESKELNQMIKNSK
ncbi:hypothetical protein WR164_02550 [Philodulcilactobacillus myokoensis]|uniref:NIPSNAP domain-containing protein n=1 Tax=Philodulcilactobacillus myokoensis TaxID=2929573 RepID=A0A9W6B0D9_9LACO|nr:hypothetical protein [Philodulcilactobacillus myokoensis]GLB46276.1 hypothetical protein WR164_02550 [Philodulcilactobacillus myokoensis]